MILANVKRLKKGNKKYTNCKGWDKSAIICRYDCLYFFKNPRESTGKLLEKNSVKQPDTG